MNWFCKHFWHNYVTVYDEIPNEFLIGRIKSMEVFNKNTLILNKVNKTYCKRCGKRLTND